MKTSKKFMLSAAIVSAMTLGACDIDKTQDGSMPDIDVDVSGGELPEYDVDVADVSVGSTEDTIIVTRPTVDVKMPDDTTDMN